MDSPFFRRHLDLRRLLLQLRFIKLYGSFCGFRHLLPLWSSRRRVHPFPPRRVKIRNELIDTLRQEISLHGIEVVRAPAPSRELVKIYLSSNGLSSFNSTSRGAEVWPRGTSGARRHAI